MKTKDVLLVVGGIALGYYASKMNWGKNTADAVSEVASGVVGTATGVVTDVKDVAVDTLKKAECETKLLQQTATMRLSEEGMVAFRTKFMADCLASK
jgi:hypothetical protein